ncbi:MAG: SDR family NAD(P)-dependent oxidoreductase [Euzebyaceae bacterium]|nr:SDR family NAD(P)-dependent oxidoreductase [Euzebyaceae bacterium]
MTTTDPAAATSGWTSADIPDQTGRTFVVTGASSGVGRAAALELARHGAHVVMACRDVGKGDLAADAICRRHPRASVEVRALDLADLSSVRAFAAAFVEGGRGLDVLVNNAGVMGLPRSLSADGYERQFATNHLGHFALTGLLLPALSAEGVRVVTVTSSGHRAGRMRFGDLMGERRYRRFGAYFQSKLANLLFTYELQRRLARAGADAIAVACHPGVSSTALGRATPVQSWVIGLGDGLVSQPAAMGALPTLRAATDPGVRGGDCFGPRGIAEMAGPPVRVASSRASHDEEVARRLWEHSVELTGVDYGGL